MKLICILSTVPSLPVARKLSHELLRKRLAACVNIIPQVESHYSWKGKLEKSNEVQLVIKTQAKHFKKIEALFKDNHPYEVPELIAFSICLGSSAYLKWVSESISNKTT